MFLKSKIVKLEVYIFLINCSGLTVRSSLKISIQVNHNKYLKTLKTLSSKFLGAIVSAVMIISIFVMGEMLISARCSG